MSYSFAGVVPHLLNLPAEEWAAYYFGQQAVEDGPLDEPFDSDAVYICDVEGSRSERDLAELVLQRIAEVHERYAEWTPLYSAGQLSQGLWKMFSYPGSFEELLLDEELPFSLRERAMRSLVVPYKVYVKGWDPEQSMPHGWWMLWDLVFGHKDPSQQIADVGLECLQQILALDDSRCQYFALHGLNHLDHPDRPSVVQAWIDAHRGEDWPWEWVEACRDGEAM